MKYYDVRALVMLLMSLAVVTLVWADDTGYRQILQERDAVLSKILAEQESRFSSGLADSVKVSEARIALWKFRRNNAATQEEKIKLQELVVHERGVILATLKSWRSVGISTSIDELLATEKLLQAKQLLAELRMKK